MGSESQKKIGMNRGVDTTRTNPLNLFIVGLDGEGDTEEQRIAWLKSLFPSLAEQIDAQRDARACRPLTEEWIAEFNPADAPPIFYTNTGATFPAEGCGRWNGKPLLLVNGGRQRTKTFRVLNERLAEDSAEPLEILCIQRRFKTTLAARESKARENVRIELTPMERAWLAQEFVDAGKPLDKIAPLVGVTSEQAVRNLLVLVDASKKVQEAVDAGVVTQTVAQEIAKKGDHAKQDEELQKRLSAAEGKSGREKGKALRGESDKSGPVKPARLAKVEEHLRGMSRADLADPHVVDGWIAIVAWARGDAAGFDALPSFFLSAVLAAEKSKKGEGKSEEKQIEVKVVECAELCGNPEHGHDALDEDAAPASGQREAA